MTYHDGALSVGYHARVRFSYRFAGQDLVASVLRAKPVARKKVERANIRQAKFTKHSTAPKDDREAVFLYDAELAAVWVLAPCQINAGAWFAKTVFKLKV